jgi:hypothetical protein
MMTHMGKAALSCVALTACLSTMARAEDGGQAGKGKSDQWLTVAAGANTYRVMLIGGNATPKADGDKLVVAGQVVSVKDGAVSFAK